MFLGDTGTDNLVFDFAAFEKEQQRDGAHIVFDGQITSAIDIDLADFGAVADFISELIDNGAGIPDALHEQVFQPYTRAHEASTQPASVGLGLSAARELARLMDGDVLHSRDNGWTRFELLLPTADQALEPPTPHAAAS